MAPSSASARWSPGGWWARARPAGAVAAVFSGLTIANIGGVPFAAWIGQHVGWRIAFAGIAGLGVIAFVAIAAGAAEACRARPTSTFGGNCR